MSNATRTLLSVPHGSKGHTLDIEMYYVKAKSQRGIWMTGNVWLRDGYSNESFPMEACRVKVVGLARFNKKVFNDFEVPAEHIEALRLKVLESTSIEA